jgi:predicted tellurium resistance membrane protein TerC
MGLFGFEHVASFFTLVFLEIVLAGDNLVLIAILANRLPESQRPLARRLGLMMAVITRLALLYVLFWISHIDTPIGGIGGQAITPRHLVFGIGGAFLIWKAIMEIGAMLGDHDNSIDAGKVRAWNGLFLLTIVQIALFDIVFSLDSVIAAIGIAKHIEVMMAAIITATAVMFFLVNPISDFIERFPIVKLIALNFLFLIGVLLLIEGLGVHVERAYFYVALAVAVAAQVVYFLLPRWAKLPSLALLVAVGGLLAASLTMDLSPYLGASAHNALRSLAESGAGAFENAAQSLQRMLSTF